MLYKFNINIEWSNHYLKPKFNSNITHIVSIRNPIDRFISAFYHTKYNQKITFYKDFFIKYLKYINNFINNLLETNLNKLNFKNLSFLFKNNKIILTFVALFVIFISYLLLPTFYNQNDIAKELKNELQRKFDLNFKFSKNIKYNFFPKPHFIITESKIFDNEKEISKISKLKIFISFDNLFSFYMENIYNHVLRIVLELIF